MEEDAREAVRAGEWRSNWLPHVKRYHIPDFSRWKDHDAYTTELTRLLKALRSSTLEVA